MFLHDVWSNIILKLVALKRAFLSNLKTYFDTCLLLELNYVFSGIVRNNSWWDYLVFGKIQQQLGGCVKLIITGSAPLEAKVLDFCRRAFGCLVSNLNFLIKLLFRIFLNAATYFF